MKLRIKGNSIRLRLLRPEVEELERAGVVTETTVFGADSTLEYRISVSDIEKVTATFFESVLEVHVPLGIAKEWFSTEMVGFDGTVDNEDEGLTILVEKDFVCLTRTDDPDNAIAYPHPEEAAC